MEMQANNAVNSQEAANFLGVTIAMVHRYCREGRLQAKKFGASWLIENKDLKEFAKKRKPPGRPPQ